MSDAGDNKKFLRGDHGLAATFWGWGFGGGLALLFFIGSILDSAGSDNLVFGLMALVFGYIAVVSIAIWRASDQYKGPVHWSVLAKIWVILTGAAVMLVLLYITAMMTSPPMH